VPTASRPLGERDLNRALLDRQLLLGRADLDLAGALERVGGLQAQYAPSIYVGLWTRVAGMVRADVDAALHRREVVQGTLLRATIHLVSARDFWPMAAALCRTRRQWWRRAVRDAPGEAELEQAAETLDAALADGPLRLKDVDGLLGKRLRDGVGYWLDLVRVPPSGTWERRRADLLDTARRWIGPPPPHLADLGSPASEAAGMEALVRRYLGAFGPGTAADVASWSGVPAPAVETVMSRMDLRRRPGQGGTDLLDLPDLTLPDPDTPAPVRFLPWWDAVLLAHARRTGVLPPAVRPEVYVNRNGQYLPTVLVDGAVRATWSFDAGHVVVRELAPCPRPVRRELAREAERLEALHA
jgi:hypothetical protein